MTAYATTVAVLLAALLLLPVLAVVWAWATTPRSRGIEIGPHMSDAQRERLLLARTLTKLDT